MCYHKIQKIGSAIHILSGQRLKINLLFLLILLGFSRTGLGQNIEDVLTEVEKNNPTLAALKELKKAEKLEQRTGILPDNPEVEFHYFWSDPAAIGSRIDFSVSQSIDFPSAYIIRKKLSELKGTQLDQTFEHQRKSILFRAKMLCNEFIYYSARGKYLEWRKNQAREVEEAIRKRFEVGEVNILERNKARFNYLNVLNEWENNETERRNIQASLEILNGGLPLHFEQDAFSPVELPAEFNLWVAGVLPKNALLKKAQQEIRISEEEIRLSRALNLPKISAGYMSESIVRESFKGVTAGISIPLWEGRNKVKLAKARQEVAIAKLQEEENRFHNRLKSVFEKAHRLQQTQLEYEQAMKSVNSDILLRKALEAGELTLMEYIMELNMYNETTDKLLSISRELHQLATEMSFYDL